MMNMAGSLSLFSGVVTAVPIFGSVLSKSYNAYGWFWLAVYLIFFLVRCYFCERLKCTARINCGRVGLECIV